MKTKLFKGKAIYQPGAKAREYAEYACNFYVGCSCNCAYCYNKTGRFKATLGGNVPTLKKCFKNEEHALEIFEKELQANLPELQKHGLFFTFTSDPFLTETANLTMRAIRECHNNAIPVKTLTKRGDNALIEYIKLWYDNGAINKNKIAFGFTLTGHDELETGASTNAERIEAMRKLHDAGFKTWASIEPIIQFEKSWEMIMESWDFCDLYKIGLMSGKKYDTHDMAIFIHRVIKLSQKGCSKIYFKDSLLKAAGISRSKLPDNCITKDFNIWKS
jgi:DNA repair photolyase